MKAFVIGLVIASLTASPVMGQCGTAYRSRAYSTYSYSYAAPTYSYAPYVEPVKVVEKVVKEIVPVYPTYAAVIPILQFQTYGAQYVPPVTYPAYPQAQQQNPQQQQAPNPAAASNGQSSELRQILDGIQGIRSTLQQQDARIRDIEEYLRRGPADPKALPKEAPKKAPEKKESSSLDIPDVKAVAKASCVMCHERGREADGGGFVLVEKDGSVAKLTARQSFNVVRHVERGTMPPAKAVTAGKAAAVTDAGASAVKEEMFRQQESRVSGG